MEYTIYLLGREVKMAEAETVASVLPQEAEAVLVTDRQEEAANAVAAYAVQGYRWAGNDWLDAPVYHCGKCGQPAGTDGEGGFRHAEPSDAVACEVMFGGGMLRSLFEED
jgi:hypothetical protein